MSCEPKLALIVLAGLISGLLLGFLFRNSDAERWQAMQFGFRSRVMRLLYAPVWTLQGFFLLIVALGLFVLVIWGPGTLLGVLPLCEPNFVLHKAALIVGALAGWFLRWLFWRKYLEYR